MNYQDYDGSPGGDVGAGTAYNGSNTFFCGAGGGYGPNIVWESDTENREWAAAWCNYDCEDWCSRHTVQPTQSGDEMIHDISGPWRESPVYALDYTVTQDLNYIHELDQC